MRIGITYNLKNELLEVLKSSPLVEDANEEFDLPETVEAIREVLASDGHEVFLLGGNLGVLGKIKQQHIEFVFNIAEGYHGRSREAHVPALLEMAGVPYSGSDPLALALTLDKSLTKRVAFSLSIPTPEFWILNEAREVDKIPHRFPLFVKPLWEGSSKGIRRSSRVENQDALIIEIARLFTNYPKQPVLVEEHIPGREFTVGILGNQEPEVLGVMEISFKDGSRKDFCYSLEVKRNWQDEVDYELPAKINSAQERFISDAALRLFKILRLRDVARFDFRMDPQGKIYFLEVNPLPGLSSESGDLVIMARKKGWSYGELIHKITQHAFSRYPQWSEKVKANAV